MSILQGAVGISNTSNADGSNPPQAFGKQADGLVSELHGKYYSANYRGKLFNAQATIQTIPLVTTTMVSVFTLYNPPGSGVNMEMVDTIIADSNATTVVDVIGWYAGTAAQTAGGTFSTKGTVLSGIVSSSAANQGLFYSAYTHSGAPSRVDVIGSFGATTNANSQPPNKIYDGRLILPPGLAMSLAASLAAASTTGADIQATWVEWPL